MNYCIELPPVTTLPVHGSDALFPVHRVYCVGRNYADHAEEMGHSAREAPFFFMKPADAVWLVSPGETAAMAYPSSTKDLHHEIELVVAIGTGGRDIAKEVALEHVFGYAVGLDMTRRDLQKEAKDKARPWDTAKGFDLSAPTGPIYPKSLVPEIGSSKIWLKIDTAVRQSSDISRMIWSVAETIEALSRFFELRPGDLIYSGTPAGVGAVKAGQTMQGGIDGLGEITVAVR